MLLISEYFVGTLSFENVGFANGINTNVINKMPIHSRALEGFTPKTDLSNIKNLQLDTLYIPVHVIAANVNGENFTEFLSSLVMKNIGTPIPGHIHIEGVSTKCIREHLEL